MGKGRAPFDRPARADPRGTFWAAAAERDTIGRAFRVAVIVGTILIFINQGDAIMPVLHAQLSGADADWSSLPPLWKVVLTYCVPYCVSTYSTASFKVDYFRQDAARRGEWANEAAIVALSPQSDRKDRILR